MVSKKLRKLVEDFCFSHDYLLRRLAVGILAKISENDQIFEQNCSAYFEVLCNDPVPNVRLFCARVVAHE